MTVAEIVEKRGTGRENLLEILHDIQESTEGHYLPEDKLKELSKAMELSVGDIVSTATFYSLFSLTPRGKHIIRVCESPPCYVMGESNVLDAVETMLGIKVGETTKDGNFTLETTSCLGTCGVAPVMMIDDEVYGNLTYDRVMDIIDEYTTRLEGKRHG
jgi:NADH-quinone oxidoreductase subunit E